MKKKKGEGPINKIRHEKRDITMDTTEIQRIIRDYYKQIYNNKMDNLEEMDEFLERYNLPRLNQIEIGDMNRSITSTDIGTVILKLVTNKSPVPNGFTGKFYQTFREELTPIFLQLLPKVAEEETLPSSFHEATIILIPKPKIPSKNKRKKVMGQYH